MNEVFEKTSDTNLILLLLGALAHALARLVPLLQSNRTFILKIWLRRNLLPHTLSTLMAVIFLVLISQSKHLVEMMGPAEECLISFGLGFSSDLAILQVERIIGWKKIVEK